MVYMDINKEKSYINFSNIRKIDMKNCKMYRKYVVSKKIAKVIIKTCL